MFSNDKNHLAGIFRFGPLRKFTSKITSSTRTNMLGNVLRLWTTTLAKSVLINKLLL